jgi:hypothetical protein
MNPDDLTPAAYYDYMKKLALEHQISIITSSQQQRQYISQYESLWTDELVEDMRSVHGYTVVGQIKKEPEKPKTLSDLILEKVQR